MDKLLERLNQPSSKRGLVLILTGILSVITQYNTGNTAYSGLIVIAGIIIEGILGVVQDEPVNNNQVADLQDKVNNLQTKADRLHAQLNPKILASSVVEYDANNNPINKIVKYSDGSQETISVGKGAL